MKLTKILILIVLTLVCVFACVGCSAKYTIQFDTKGGKETSPITVKKGELPVLTDAEHEHACFIFEGWYLEEDYITKVDNQYLIQNPPKKSVTLYAKWIENHNFLTWTNQSSTCKVCSAVCTAEEFSVTLNGNGGQNPQNQLTTTLTYYSPRGLTLPNDWTKQDKVFAGWYDNAELNGMPVHALSISDSDNKTFWAKWEDPTEWLSFRATKNKDDVIIAYSVILGDAQAAATATSAVVPAYYEGLPVTEISNDTFKNLITLTSVYIPQGIVGIGADAFSGCSGLTQIALPSSITIIGTNAFNICENIKKLQINDLVAWCRITLNSERANPMYCGADLYLNSQKIEQLVLPSNLANICNAVFYGCTSIQSLYISHSTKNIGISAFNGCTQLSALKIPSNVTVVGNSAFENCSSLETVTIMNDSGLLYLYENTFGSCQSLTTVTIGDDSALKAIDPVVFRQCFSLQSITFGKNSVLKIIDESAFYHCSSLEEITIPSSVEIIAKGAFSDCTSLTTVTFFSDSALKSLGDSAFCNCISLTSFTVPIGVENIGMSAFYDCDSLTDVTFLKPEGWYISMEYNDANGNLMDVNSSIGNARMLSISYSDHYWKRADQISPQDPDPEDPDPEDPELDPNL